MGSRSRVGATGLNEHQPFFLWTIYPHESAFRHHKVIGSLFFGMMETQGSGSLLERSNSALSLAHSHLLYAFTLFPDTKIFLGVDGLLSPHGLAGGTQHTRI